MSSSKRSRASYEADLQAQQSPFVFFGTPLPPLDPDTRDDGSYVPVWKQEVRDERGRKRLHGAFTGGWSAGYFNTVGSKEGWTPSTFVSSRTNRRKDDTNAAQLRPEDFMDEEDLADAEEARKIQTSDSFVGLGSTERDSVRTAGLAGLFLVEGETMGTKLLKKMGWREGQGIGPKVRRGARLEVGNTVAGRSAGETHLFAPENVAIINFDRKMDRKGLGFEGESRMAPLGPGDRLGGRSDDEDDADTEADPIRPPQASFTLKIKSRDNNQQGRGGFGVGILNDTGSDDEDPYEIGPKISYNRVIGGDKKKKKTTNSQVSLNPTIRSKPVFSSNLARIGVGIRRGHDGRLPLDGFVFGQEPDPLTSMINSQGMYPPPEIPPGWVSARQQRATSAQTAYVSTADAARVSSLDSKARAALLGEKHLPGKSVFDFISPSARDRLATATGRTDLPQARGEVPEGFEFTEAEKAQSLLGSIPELDGETAVAALSRGAGPGAPYADDAEKRARYRHYLEHQAGFTEVPPMRRAFLRHEEWVRELHEFRKCAQIFKPMTGLMASRFTTSSAASQLSTGSSGQLEGQDLIAKPAAKPKDPAEEAAALGMYGQMTRSVADFYPTRLLCKRFNVKPPAHVQPDQEGEDGVPRFPSGSGPDGSGFPPGFGGPTPYLPAIDAQPFGAPGPETQPVRSVPGVQGEHDQAVRQEGEDVMLDTTRNPALEGKRAGDELFKAIFGDSEDEE